jgi:hypothetical protein
VAAFALHSLGVGPISPLCLATLLEYPWTRGAPAPGCCRVLAFAWNTLINKLARAFAGLCHRDLSAWGGYVPTMEVASPTLSYC